MTSAELETLARTIAPADIGSHPVYFCFASELPTALKPNAAVWGFTGPVLDIAFADWLRDCRRWRGRGPAIVLNDSAMRADAESYAQDDTELANELFRQRILAIASHELAHVLSAPIDFRPIPAGIRQEIETRCKSVTASWVAKDGQHDPEMPPPFKGHEAAFIRTLLHVHHRYQLLACERLPESQLFSHRAYALSRLGCYRRAMEAEILGFDRSLTFADLRQCSPPKQFIELWKSDLHRWWNDDRTDARMMQMVAAMAPYVRAG